MHDCSVATGDQWLSNAVPALLHKGAIVVITFDEGNGTANHVMTAMVGPGVVPGTRNAVSYNHYGLLAGLETYFGVHQLNHASTAKRLPI
jgi:hypothetical protein